MILLKEQHPELDIRIVFQDMKKPIYRGSKTTYAKWATDHGFTAVGLGPRVLRTETAGIAVLAALAARWGGW